MYTPMEVKKKKGTVTVKHAYQSKNGDDREVAGSTKNEEIPWDLCRGGTMLSREISS